MTANRHGKGRTARFTGQALALLRARYLAKDKTGQIVESPKDMYMRVARSVAGIDRRYGATIRQTSELSTTFYRMMLGRIFLPNSPTLINAGRAGALLSACSVIPVSDGIRGVLQALFDAAQVQKAGAGTGFDFSHLPPSGDGLFRTGGSSLNPLTSIDMFAHASDVTRQGGVRQGANMAVLRVDHPDIVGFILAKHTLGRWHNFNLSVAVTDDFMNAVRHHPNQRHRVIDPRTGHRFALSKGFDDYWTVGEVFDLLVSAARDTGEPGVLFIDTINRANPTPHLGRIEATNPCGEQPLLPYETCNLGSLNLVKFIQQRGARTWFDYRSFAKAVVHAVRFLDNVIDLNSYPFTELQRVTEGNRKIGLGIMGFADALYNLGIPYDSDRALAFASSVMNTLADQSHQASEDLAKRRGVFPNWPGSVWEERCTPMRNACTTCIAPTGSISILARCSAGIEPCFALVYVRNLLNGRRFLEVNRVFKSVAQARGFYSPSLMEQIAGAGSIQKMSSIPEDVRRVFVTALDISPIWHVKMMAAFQSFADGAVSKTVNLPKKARPKDVKTIFLAAHAHECKGITVSLLCG